MISRSPSPCLGTTVPTLLLVLLIFFVVEPSTAKKTLPTSQPYAPSLVHRHSCEVCHYMIGKAYDAVEKIRNNATRRTPLKEDEILQDIIEPLCNPFHREGSWLRLLDIQTAEVHGSAPLRKTTLLRPTEQYTKCKRDCATVAASCELVLQSDEGEQLSGLLYRKKSLAVLEDTVCGAACEGSQRLRTSKPHREYLATDKLIVELEKETVEYISEKELDMEEMMERMQRGREIGQPGVDVFTREEMMNMQDAIQKGDQAALEELDPAAADLSEEDFEMVRRMYQGESDEEM